MLALLLATSACRDESLKASVAPRNVAPGRGDHVVVEQTAAVFFEGRVLSADGKSLRIQAADDKSSRTVAASDVYRLPAVKVKGTPSKPAERPRPGELAICRSEPQRWQPCRIEQVQDDRVAAVSAGGERLELATDGVLQPSPVTELNLRRHFERTRERREFSDARARAGDPKVPSEFRPLPRERVLARAEGGWYTAYVHQIEDDGVRVAWQSDRGISMVMRDSIVPEPPYTTEIHRGDFVLVRPDTPALPWQPMLVRSVGAGELRIVDIEGRQRSISARDVVPLGQG